MFTLERLLAATGGRVARGRPDPIARFAGGSNDSRTVAPGEIFFALRDQRDGHDFVADALRRGAAGAVVQRIPEELPWGGALSDGPLLLGAGAVFGLYALQAFTMNQFAADRSGLTLQFLVPLSSGALVLGKAVGCALVYAATLLLALVCALGIAPGGSPLEWAAVLLGSGATYALLTPSAALLSAWLPVASDLGKTGSGGNPHGLAMAVGTVLVLLAAAPPAAIVLLVHRGMERPLLGSLLMAGWASLALALAIPLLRLASRTIGPRRENLALVAGSR